MKNKKIECPRCESDKIDSLRDKYGRSINIVMYGNCDYECRSCSYKFIKDE